MNKYYLSYETPCYDDLCEESFTFNNILELYIHLYKLAEDKEVVYFRELKKI